MTIEALPWSFFICSNWI